MSISITPTYPIPNKPVSVVFTLQETGSNFVRVWATVAPTGSLIDLEINNSKASVNRYEIYSGNGGIDFPLNTTFDKGGKYTLIVQEYLKGSGYGGGYENDPAGSDLETKIGSETTHYIYIGQRMTQDIGPVNNRASLNLWVWDDTIRATYKSIHGESTPSITADPATDLVKTAIESNTVKTALLALVGQSCSTVIGSISAFVTSYYNNWNSHIASDDYHNESDTLNTIPSSLATAYTPATLKDFINESLRLQRYHFLDDSTLDFSIVPPNPTGPGVADFHNISDQPNLSLYQSVGSFDESYGALVDLIRTFNSHKIASGVHDINDTENMVTSLSLLMSVHSAYLTVIASSNPPVPAAQSTGAQILMSGAGFKEK